MSVDIKKYKMAPGVTASVCSARELIAPARAKSSLRGIEAAVKDLTETLNKTRSVG